MDLKCTNPVMYCIFLYSEYVQLLQFIQLSDCQYFKSFKVGFHLFKIICAYNSVEFFKINTVHVVVFYLVFLLTECTCAV